MTPSDPFVHLHVASGFSLRHGASHPHVLVQRAADHGMDALALTDRDGVYGAVRFALACRSAGVAPILGVDLAVEADPATASVAAPSASAGPGRRERSRTPARGGADVDRRLPRVTVLAQGRQGWAALCRLVSRAHTGTTGAPSGQVEGEDGARALGAAPGGGARGGWADRVPERRRDPSVTVVDVAAAAAGGHLGVVLGPQSDVGAALARRRPDLAEQALRRWHDAVDPGDLVLEVVSHRVAGDTLAPGSTRHAAHMLRLARDHALPAVLSNVVRYADAADAPVVDVLDAVRRLVPLHPRHLDRSNAEGYLKSGKEMVEVAEEVLRAAGRPDREAADLLLATRRVAERFVLDPRADLGLGEIHFPEADLLAGLGAVAPGERAAAAAGARDGDAMLRARCEAGLVDRYGPHPGREVRDRLEDELGVIARLGYAAYFLTVAQVCDLTRSMGVRVAARGSGAGSLVCYTLGISGVEPMRHGLLMERFLSPLRQALPDIDVDVESARRLEVYEAIFDRFGADRVACVSMMDTYRVRHAVRDVGAALGLPPGEVDAIAKAFPHIRARDARLALTELPELRASRLGEALHAGELDVLLSLVERLDGLPRHVALHPCGVILSDPTLLDRTPTEPSLAGFPMSQFDKDDVENLGLLKLDVLGIRMQSAMAHAVDEIARVDAVEVDLDDRGCVPLDDPATFRLIQSTRTLGCFQIESPGQRELIGKFAPETFDDVIIDISLFRPGPVKSDMVTPFLHARQGWAQPQYLHPDLQPALAETCGVVVFHEQVLRVIATITGCSLAEADEARRALGDLEGKQQVRAWFPAAARARGYDEATTTRVWEVLEAFASFGFCKAHAAAFALPTYQSAWLKTHHTAAFLAGVLTHDPGMYPKRLILEDARAFGIAVLPLDVNLSDPVYRVEKVGENDEPPPVILGSPPRHAPPDGLPDARRYGIRLALADVAGITDDEVARIVGGRPYHSLTDFWYRARASRPVVERLVLTGAFDGLYGLGSTVPVRRRDRVTRRDLLLQLADLDGVAVRRTRAPARSSPRAPRAEQLTLDLDDDTPPSGSGLPEMTSAERVRAELEILGLDASRHVVDFYTPFLDALGVTRATEMLRRRSKAELLVAGVKVATQTPPVRSGRRVIFLTLDDGTGPVDATFFEDAQGPYAATLFHSWLLVVRGELRRTGPRGVSLRATGCWELTALHEAWQDGGLPAVHALMAGTLAYTPEAVQAMAASRSTRPVMVDPPAAGAAGTSGGRAGAGLPGVAAASALPGAGQDGYEPRGGLGEEETSGPTAGGMGRRRVLVHPSGFRQSPYADIKPAGGDAGGPPRKLWHASPGSSGR
jgi:error-prone DNA polymerase